MLRDVMSQDESMRNQNEHKRVTNQIKNTDAKAVRIPFERQKRHLFFTSVQSRLQRPSCPSPATVLPFCYSLHPASQSAYGAPESSANASAYTVSQLCVRKNDLLLLIACRRRRIHHRSFVRAEKSVTLVDSVLLEHLDCTVISPMSVNDLANTRDHGHVPHRAGWIAGKSRR